MLKLSRLVVLLVAVSCAVPTATPTPTSDKPANQGNLSVQVPAVADWLAPFVKQSSAGARALLYATSVQVGVFTAGGSTVVDYTTLSVTNPGGSGSAGATAGLLAVPVGSNYTIRVYVYDSGYSTYNAVVSGELTGVSVTKNQTTTVDVNCVPVYSSVLHPNVHAGDTMQASTETWYKLTTLAGLDYALSQSTASTPAFLFSSTGVYIATITSSTPYSWTSAQAADYYVGVANTASGSRTSDLLVEADVPLSNEGSAAAPVTVSVDTSRTFLLGAADAADETSYYKVTPSASGDYYLSLPGGYAGIIIYSDASFTSLVEYGQWGNGGGWLTSLSAGVPYYLKVTNYSGDVYQGSGQLMSPTKIAAVTKAKGTPSAPISLTLGTVKAGTIGYSGPGAVSYYQFTTGASPIVDISFSSVTGDSTVLNYTIGTDPTWGSYIEYGASSSSADKFLLQASTTYYLAVSESDPSNYADTNQTSFNVLVATGSAPASTAASLDTAINDTTASGVKTKVYDVTVPGAGNYIVSWEDFYDEASASAFTGDIAVSAYSSDYTTRYFNRMDDGYSSNASNRKIAVSGSSPQLIHIVVSAYYKTGTFSVKVNSPNEGSLVVRVH